MASLKFFDDYNHKGGRKSLREFLGHTWLRTLERVQGVIIPDESEGEGDLRKVLETIFNSPESFNIRVETASLLKVELVKGRLSLDAMQSYAARFAATLDYGVPKFPDPNDQLSTTEPFTRGLSRSRCVRWSSTFELSTFPMCSISFESNARHQLSRWSISRLRNRFGSANFALDSSSKSQATHRGESAGQRKPTQRERTSKLF